jgi:hypothetical protein
MGKIESLSQGILGLPWGELIVMFLGESSKPLWGTFHQRKFEATYFEESLDPNKELLTFSKEN